MIDPASHWSSRSGQKDAPRATISIFSTPLPPLEPYQKPSFCANYRSFTETSRPFSASSRISIAAPPSDRSLPQRPLSPLFSSLYILLSPFGRFRPSSPPWLKCRPPRSPWPIRPGSAISRPPCTAKTPRTHPSELGTSRSAGWSPDRSWKVVPAPADWLG